MSQKCWCGSRRAFSSCCEPYLKQMVIAPTAEALMRSRYSAFCTGNVDYLMATHHPSARQGKQGDADERAQLDRSIQRTQWINLLIIKTQKGQKKDKAGRVEFVAAYQPKPSPLITATVLDATVPFPRDLSQSPIPQSPISQSPISQLHEDSRFVREQGRWFYVDGDMLPDYQPKRSHPCWCGSGKPYKHCHFSR